MRRRTRVTSPLLASTGLAALVVGVLGLLCGSCGAIDTLMLAGSPAGDDVKAYLWREAPLWIPIASIRAIGLLCLSVTAIVAGLGLLARQEWARWVALVYGLISIPLHLVHGVYGVAVYMPAMEQYMGFPGRGGSASFRGGFLVTFAPPLVIWLAAAIFLVVTMLSPQAARALERKSKTKRRRRDDDDDFE